MSRQLRIIGVSLLISATLLKEWSIPFTKWVAQNYEFNAFILAIKNIAPTLPMLEMTAVFPAIFIFLCLGSGLLLSCAVDVLLEKMLWPLLHKIYALVGECTTKRDGFQKLKALI